MARTMRSTLRRSVRSVGESAGSVDRSINAVGQSFARSDGSVVRSVRLFGESRPDREDGRLPKVSARQAHRPCDFLVLLARAKGRGCTALGRERHACPGIAPAFRKRRDQWHAGRARAPGFAGRTQFAGTNPANPARGPFGWSFAGPPRALRAHSRLQNTATT